LAAKAGFRVRKTPAWKLHAADLEAEMLRRGMTFEVIEWYEADHPVEEMLAPSAVPEHAEMQGPPAMPEQPPPHVEPSISQMVLASLSTVDVLNDPTPAPTVPPPAPAKEKPARKRRTRTSKQRPERLRAKSELMRSVVECGDGGLVRGNRIQVAHFTEPVAPHGCSRPQILVGLRMRAKAAEMARMRHQIATVDIQLPAGGCEDSRRGRAGRGEAGDPQGRSRRGRSVVDPHGGIWRTRATLADDRAMPQWRLRLAAGAMPPLRNRGQHSAPTRAPAARYADLETRGGAEMPVVPNAALRAAGAHDPLTEERQTAPYVWVHPDDDDR